MEIVITREEVKKYSPKVLNLNLIISSQEEEDAIIAEFGKLPTKYYMSNRILEAIDTAIERYETSGSELVNNSY